MPSLNWIWRKLFKLLYNLFEISISRHLFKCLTSIVTYSIWFEGKLYTTSNSAVVFHSRKSWRCAYSKGNDIRTLHSETGGKWTTGKSRNIFSLKKEDRSIWSSTQTNKPPRSGMENGINSKVYIRIELTRWEGGVSISKQTDWIVTNSIDSINLPTLQEQAALISITGKSLSRCFSLIKEE